MKTELEMNEDLKKWIINKWVKDYEYNDAHINSNVKEQLDKFWLDATLSGETTLEKKLNLNELNILADSGEKFVNQILYGLNNLRLKENEEFPYPLFSKIKTILPKYNWGYANFKLDEQSATEYCKSCLEKNTYIQKPQNLYHKSLYEVFKELISKNLIDMRNFMHCKYAPISLVKTSDYRMAVEYMEIDIDIQTLWKKLLMYEKLTLLRRRDLKPEVFYFVMKLPENSRTYYYKRRVLFNSSCPKTILLQYSVSPVSGYKEAACETLRQGGGV